MRNLLAFDLGASNGRAILGQFDGEKITMRELHRFENNYIEMNGVFYWDLPYLYSQLKQGLLAFKNANIGELDCIGIDTWGVDYGLLDKNGHLLSNPRSYRYAVDADMEAVWKTVDFPTLFARTGIATMNFNTVYQLYRRKLQDDPALANAETLLFMPDLLGYFLTGEKKSEYTEATTSMLYNPTTKDWDWQTIEALGLPKKIFTPLDRAGSLRGTLRPELAEEIEEEIPEFCYRLKMKAGLTGYAQVYGKYNTTSYDKLKLDLTYIRNYSLLLDLKLMLMTPKIMMLKESTEGVADNGNASDSRHPGV